MRGITNRRSRSQMRYFAEALAGQYDAALMYIKENRLPVWTHNKAIQKAAESRKISDSRKTALKGFRRSGKNE